MARFLGHLGGPLHVTHGNAADLVNTNASSPHSLPMQRTTVLIVDDDLSVAQVLAHHVASAPEFEVVGTMPDVASAKAAVSRLRPQVLLTDLGLPDGTGVELIAYTREQLPACEMLVITVFDQTDKVIAAIRAGAAGYLLKNADEAEVVRHIRMVCSGGSPINPRIARRLLRHAVAGQPDLPDAMAAQAVSLAISHGVAPLGPGVHPAAACAESPGVLSPQEIAVLTLSAKGYRYREIARALGLSTHTVSTYVKRVYFKLQVHSKTEAIYEARQLGIPLE